MAQVKSVPSNLSPVAVRFAEYQEAVPVLGYAPTTGVLSAQPTKNNSSTKTTINCFLFT
jgi:hypothetical protein